MRFSKKTAHRLIISLCMFAPIAYLFGAMFFGLAGAHGEEIYKDEIVIKETPDYDELMQPENFNYGAFDWENEHGTRLGFSLGFLKWDTSLYDTLTPYCGLNGVQVYGNYDNYGLGFVGDFWGDDLPYIGVYVDYNHDMIGLDDIYADGAISLTSGYSCFYLVSSNQMEVIVVYCGFDYTDPSDPSDFIYSMEWINNAWSSNAIAFDYGEYYVYFDDGAHLPEGVLWNDKLASYFVPSVKPVEVTTSTYTASIFGQMFPHDNFLERVGSNALSASPVGFAPFATLVSTLDNLVFHGSESQLALMVYGEVYWALHVVLADLVYHVAVFIPNLVNRVFDMFSNKGVNDE